MTYKYTAFFKWVSIINDYLVLNLALGIGLLIESPEALQTNLADSYKINFLLFNLFWFYCAKMVGLYNNILTREAVPTAQATLYALLLFLVGPVAVNFTLPHLSLTTQFISYTFVLFAFILFFSKTAFLLLRKSNRRFWFDIKHIVIVGAGQKGQDLYKYIQKNPHMGYRIAGLFDDTVRSADNKNILGKVKDCLPFAKSNGISEIFCALPNKDLEQIKTMMVEADKQMLRFRLVPDINDFLDKKVMVDFYGHMPILTPRQEPLEIKTNEILKRAFDILFSLFVILCVLSWLTPLIALLIKLESKGTVFFRQLRSGKDNKPFYCLKFRSMRQSKDSSSKQATKGDMRITRLGAFIRKTSIDELPQFFNVLMGSMSVVGPRPHMLKHTEDYSQLIDKYMVRQFLTPGISGWAQVSGFRGETKETSSMDKRVQADIWYLENWSLMLDLKIIFLTVWQAIKGSENAY